MNSPHLLSLAVHAAAWAIPSTLALFAIASPLRAERASLLALGLTLMVSLGAGLTGWGALHDVVDVGARVDAVTATVLLLVTALGVVVVRYSRTYLQGDPGLERYFRWMLLTLSAVSALIVANNLLLMTLGWTAASLALHQLLTFYSDRPAALIAAHKKFLVSRLADVCLLATCVLVYGTVGSMELERIAAWATANPSLSPSMQLAAVLVVLAVSLRTAQLPFHGWLTQVMEAPTPVSALLHAGVVNIGGLVLIRLAPWMVHSTVAQLLLVAIGLTSVIVAALVMTTRVSVKVNLAWSTCAQMGFMLMQCGLGLWHLALLHLVAHSLYKAHAFLSTGTAVEEWRRRAATKPSPAPSWTRLGASVGVALTSAAIAVAILAGLVPPSPAEALSLPVLAVLVSLSMVPLVTRATADLRAFVATAVRMTGVVVLYVGWHLAAAELMPSAVEAPSGVAFQVAWLVVGLSFIALFAVKATLQMLPGGRVARALYPWLYAGFYLDERFTQRMFRFWPHRLPPRAQAGGHVPATEALQVQA